MKIQFLKSFWLASVSLFSGALFVSLSQQSAFAQVSPPVPKPVPALNKIVWI